MRTNVFLLGLSINFPDKLELPKENLRTRTLTAVRPESGWSRWMFCAHHIAQLLNYIRHLMSYHIISVLRIGLTVSNSESQDGNVNVLEHLIRT